MAEPCLSGNGHPLVAEVMRKMGELPLRAVIHRQELKFESWCGEPIRIVTESVGSQRCHMRRDLPGVSRSSIYDIRA
jgi:hypothetical protein